jgi:hypothetical protein
MPRKFGKIVTKPSKSKARWLEMFYIVPRAMRLYLDRWA